MHPSRALYQALQSAFDHFNRELFDGDLPPVIFTVQRQKDVMGYFAPDRWISPEGECCHEIAINPAHMGQSRVIEVLQTIAHEMVHCWQHCLGKPGRRCYHNKEWANKMIHIGLYPSSTGLPGGKITGQHMSDYPVENGPFMKACHSLVELHAFRLPWIYRVSLPRTVAMESPENELAAPAPETTVGDQQETPAPPQDLAPDAFLHSSYSEVLPEGSFYLPPVKVKSKVKYQCPSCITGVWGKPGINLICGNCRIEFQELG